MRGEMDCEAVRQVIEMSCPGLWIARQILQPAGFDDPAFLVHRRLFGVKWDRQGAFFGAPTLEVRGGRDYQFRLTDPPFGFRRHDGREFYPLNMVTDGGSVPRAAWCVPGLNPWDYMPAFIIHDWLFVEHHCRPGGDVTFEDANLIMAEAIYTMMTTGLVTADWRLVEVIHHAVSSSIGRGVWDRAWTPEQCTSCLS